ncbi:MAG: hypothetical protein MJ101_00615 [Clostridia bacterium]|nr:hypothetical protein [Clostridia bacterium]
MAEKVINIVNFVRACEPRTYVDLVTPIREELRLCRENGLPNTVLVQYDTMLNDELMDVVLQAQSDGSEIGVWFEVVKPLTDQCGLPWRGREGWAWDWHIVPGFLMAYTQAERRALCDEVMRLFREKFGAYPLSVGSWLLDSYSMEYMSRNYGIKAFCVCRDQDNTDAYTLWGGYFNGPYYPSRINMISPAVDMKNAIRTPCFRMLTPDPIYNYLNSVAPKGERIPCTLEPVWASGQNRHTVDWYFDEVLSDLTVGYGYMQVGQENSFGWDRIGKGLPYQIEKVVEARNSKRAVVKTLGQSGIDFLAAHGENIPESLVADSDWRGNPYKSAWYMTKYYRANVFAEGDKLYFRDIHKNSDKYEEEHYSVPCPSWKATYDTLPVSDKWNFFDENDDGIISLDGTFENIVLSAHGDSFTVTASSASGDVAIELDESCITVRGASLTFEAKPSVREGITVQNDRVTYTHNGLSYSVGIDGRAEKTGKGYRIDGIDGVIRLNMSLSED